jgi:hypothetical protein
MPGKTWTHPARQKHSPGLALERMVSAKAINKAINNPFINHN